MIQEIVKFKIDDERNKVIGFCFVDGEERENVSIPFTRIDDNLNLIRFSNECLSDLVNMINSSLKKV
jgi:hypothetical protein